MMFLAPIGLGMLANLVGGAVVSGEAAQQNQQALADLNRMMAEAEYHPTDNIGAGFQSNLDAPPFPNEAANNLLTMQQQNASVRSGFMNQTQQELSDMKQQFFSENHLETTQAQTPDGQTQDQVALNEQGQPQVASGAETPQQSVARQNFESNTRSQLADKHDQQTQKFVEQQKQDFTQFLQANKPELGNPAVQAELQKMLILSHKKALGLRNRQQEEGLKCDLYSPEQVAVADDKLGQLRGMEDQHAQMEDESPEAGELYQHQQDLAELLRQKRDEAQRTKLEEAFLNGPPRFSSEGSQSVDVATVLPPYLSNALYNMGIYSV